MGDYSEKMIDLYKQIRVQNQKISSAAFELLYTRVSSSQDFKIIEDIANRTLFILWENGTELNLKNFLPKGFHLEPSTGFACNFDRKAILYVLDLLSSQATILMLFHEIGHAHESWYDRLMELIHSYIIIPIKLFYCFRAGKLISDMVGCNRKIAEELINDLDVQSLVPVKYLQMEHKYTASSERMASAYALKQLRNLRRQGYNVFSGFSNVTEIQQCISAALMTYDLNYQSELVGNIYQLFGKNRQSSPQKITYMYARKDNKFAKYLRSHSSA